MILAILIPLIFTVVGLIFYFASANPKVVRIAELTFLSGLLVMLYALVSHPQIGHIVQ